jgi:DnaJ-class molecular chaperone
MKDLQLYLLLVLSSARLGVSDVDHSYTKDNTTFLFAERIVSSWNFYQRLNISNDASFADIKRSYRKHIVFFHPDKLIHNFTKDAKEDRLSQFLLVQEAYETLSNPFKRSSYDFELIATSTGNENSSTKPKRENSNEFWNEFPSLSLDGIYKLFMYSSKNMKLKFNLQFPTLVIPDIFIPLSVPLQYYFDGGELNTSYHRRRICSYCQGSGALQNQQKKTCEDCTGTGYNWKKFEKNGIQYQQLSYSKCETCFGKGFIIIKKCPYCGGVGFSYLESWLMVQIPCGFYPYQRYIYPSLGHESSSSSSLKDVNKVEKGSFGDLEIELQYDLPSGYVFEEVAPPPAKGREGIVEKNSTGNIFYTHNITINDLHKSSSGEETSDSSHSFLFQYLTGDYLQVTIPEGVTVEDILNRYEIRKEKMGLFPNRTTETLKQENPQSLLDPEVACNHEHRGDLIVKFNLNWNEISAQEMINSMLVRVFFPLLNSVCSFIDTYFVIFSINSPKMYSFLKSYKTFNELKCYWSPKRMAAWI